MRPALLVLAALALPLGPARAAPRVDSGAARLLTDAVAVALQKHDALDVLTSDDVRRAVDLEAQRQTLGCDQSSCLAEVAGALGAALVVYGSVGSLGDDVALTLNLFDSTAASSAGRVLVRAPSVGVLADRVPAAVDDLLARRGPASSRRRVLVLDLATTDAAAAGPTSTAPPLAPATAVEEGEMSWLVVGGGAAAGLGLLAVGVGAAAAVVADQQNAVAVNPKTPQAAAASAYQQRDAAGWTALALFASGGLVAAGGSAALVAGMVGE